MEVVWNALPNPEITFRRLNFPNNWEQFLTLNPRTGRLYVVEEPPLAMDKNFSLRALRTYTNKDGVPQRRWKLSVRNPPSFKIDRVREFDYSPYRDYPPPVVVAQRFVVSSKRNKWAVTDLDSQDRTAFEHPALAGGVDEFSHCYSIANTNNFVYLNYDSQPKTNTPVSQIRIELFGIRASGVPHLINSWFVATKGVTAFLLYDDQLVSINPIERHFEFRSASDGKLISIKALPPDLDLTIDRFDFMGGNLLVNNANRAFSFEKLRWLKTPIGTRYFGESPDKKLQLWRDDHEWVVTDGESERELARIGRGSYALFIDNETVMQFSNSWGFTCCTVAARTGTTIMSWRPNWWAFPLLLFTVPAYVVWSFLWLKTVSESSRNAWWDIALIAGLPIAAFSIRFAFVGQSYDLNRYPSHLIFGIFLAVAFVASVWLWSSQQNIVLRCLPWLWSLIAIANVLVFVFAQRSSYGDQSRVVFKEFFLLAVLVPVFAICFLFRLGGFRLNRDTHFSSSKMFTCSLKDLLIIVATCALLFSPLRSIELEVLMMEADQADFTLWPYILIAAFSPCLAWFLAMSKNRSFFLVGVCLSILALAWLLFDVLDAFVEGQYFQIDGNWIYSLYDHFSLNWDNSILFEWYSLLRISSTAFVSTFLLAHVFRYRGWRWDRASRRMRSSLRGISGSTNVHHRKAFLLRSLLELKTGCAMRSDTM